MKNDLKRWWYESIIRLTSLTMCGNNVHTFFSRIYTTLFIAKKTFIHNNIEFRNDVI